jgi:hypothetical protein
VTSTRAPRVGSDPSPTVEERLRTLGESARQELRRAARRGDRAARRALEDLGELPPAPRSWVDTDDSGEDAE